MEIETNQSMVAKKVWNTIRIVLFMLRKGIAKSRVMAELNLLLKRGKIAAVKAISNTLTLRHHYAASAFTCHRATSFVAPRDYEFSCSNSPAFPKFRINKHHHNHHRHHHHRNRFSHHHNNNNQYDDVLTVQKVLEILNNNSNDKVAAGYSSPFSPLVTLPGFGKSPIGKLVRITDSPFPLKNEGEDDDDDDCHVDIAAEEFIKRFYKDLNLQQNLAAIQSPSPYHKDR